METGMDTITLSIEEYKRLLRDRAELYSLDAAGVDNWAGRDEVDWDSIDGLVEEWLEEKLKSV